MCRMVTWSMTSSLPDINVTHMEIQGNFSYFSVVLGNLVNVAYFTYVPERYHK